ncbi:phytanoyl-CoA dioxygenase family protein [Sphingomonas sp. IC4-52]|uniref:phytanoyl-CoA dioxygenase family protein n=1 Tax=Sphingomonas sp. IC4-52 TaxID=2887202 RepID=UPI001D121244|nr:phytanoyl-CoA dioxygenase family protein [Sphingomonas sp. IC4-52]MCC2980622.1 phytanoyl-CoA dioxygenase family protein [Sphingomonas sp. IC4-52]
MMRDPTPATAALTLGHDGAQLYRGALTAHLGALLTAVDDLPDGQAGVRINGLAPLRSFLAPTGPIGSIAAGVLGPSSRAVRAVLFDKTEGTNWSLGWHQDRTICVRQRIDAPGFGPWTVKGGMQHVAPPFELLARMVTMRVHLDDVPATNAPLLIAPGSHKAGRIPVDRIDAAVNRHGTAACLAQAGDAWLYATPILHASQAAAAPMRRRVLQIDFAAEDLPGDLEWLGV